MPRESVRHLDLIRTPKMSGKPSSEGYRFLYTGFPAPIKMDHMKSILDGSCGPVKCVAGECSLHLHPDLFLDFLPFILQ